MRPTLLVAGVLAAALSATPAAAVPGDAKSVYGMGKCIAGADREVAGSLLRNLPLSASDVSLASAELGRAARCAKAGRLDASSLLLRGGIAQALLLRDFPRFGVPPEIAQRLFVRFDLPIGDSPPAGLDPHTASLYRLAECVVRNQAIRTEMLFRSGIGSSIESRQINVLRPTMRACKGDDGEIRVSHQAFRSMMAQAAYNISVRYWTGQLWSAP